MCSATAAPHWHPIGGPARALVDAVAGDDEAGALRAIGTIEADPVATRGLLRVATGFGLSAFERDLLVLVGLPEEHEAFTMLAQRLHPAGDARLTYAGIASLLGLDEAGRRHLRRALQAGPLRQNGLVEVASGAPLPHASLALSPRLWSMLRGIEVRPPSVDFREITPLAEAPIATQALESLLVSEPRLILMTGGDERPVDELAAAVRRALDELGRSGVFVDGADFGADAQRALSVHAIASDAVPVLLGPPTGTPLATHPQPVIVCVARAAGIELDGRPVLSIDLGIRELRESLEMWSGLAPELNGEVQELASTLRVDPVRAERAIADARATCGIEPLTVADIVGQVRRRTDSDLPASVRLVRPRSRWDRLVTTEDTEKLLRTIVGRIRSQVHVLHEWGFGDLAAAGVKTLFAGPPGTGKTLSAEIIAADLGLDLLVVDLSALVSKWLGETEKNLSEVFDAAERCQSVLFFDEADALFGRRTDGSDAQGRWANLETAHLLGRIDAFGGLCVLATNLRGNIDDAFVRRLDVIVEFDEPGVDERLRLWETHLPPEAPLAVDVDLRQLAEVYELTGGLVRNASLAAAFRAAELGHHIDQRTLLDAVEQEYRKAGRSFPGIPRALIRTPAGGS